MPVTEMPMMRKVAHVRLNYLPLSEVFIHNEITGIEKYRTAVLCWDTENLDRFPHPEIYPLSALNPLSYYYNRYTMRRRGTSSHFCRVVKEKDIDLVHAQFGDAGARTIGLRERTGAPHITSFRGYDASTLPKEVPGIYNRLFEKGDLFLTRSERMSRDLMDLGAPKGKVRVHHSSVDLSLFRFRERRPPGRGERIRLLSVGRLTEKKGMPEALEAFSRVVKKNKDLRFTIIGDGPQKEELERMIADKGLKGKARLLGPRPHPEVLGELDRSHIFMLACRTASDGDKEGIPNVVMEAQAMGLPLVTTDHAGIPEAVPEGMRPRLAPEGDVDALAGSLEGLLNEGERWPRMGREGRRHIGREFNLQRQSRRLEKYYDGLLMNG
jgi:glycosyltransferase involved in cell wall biosynthesis